MRRISALAIACMLVVTPGFASDVTVNVGEDHVDAADGQLTIEVALPVIVIGKRVNRAVLEVPIDLGVSDEAVFDDYPLMELYELGSETPKQTVLLGKGFSGIARFDVTRVVRAWSTTDARQLVLGAVSESNRTAFTLVSAEGWANSTKARLVIEYSDRDGRSVSSDAE